jgi:hypothetical protein
MPVNSSSWVICQRIGFSLISKQADHSVFRVIYPVTSLSLCLGLITVKPNTVIEYVLKPKYIKGKFVYANKKNKKMKTIMIILASMVLLTAGTGKVNAGNPKHFSIDRLLKKEITYPDFARSQKLEGMVLVSFSLNPDGTINIQLTNESSATLKDYVVSKLKSLRFATSSGGDNKTYNVKFVFTYEN